MRKIHIAPSANSTRDVVRALRGCAGDIELEFEAAEYHFYGEGAFEQYFAPTNNFNSVKRIVFPMIGMENVVVSGNGARFVFHARLFPVIVSGSRNVTLRDFNIDFAFPRYAVGKVLEKDAGGITLMVDGEKYPYYIEDKHLIFRAGDEVRSTGIKKFFMCGLPGSSFDPMYMLAGDTIDPLIHLPAPFLRTDAVDMGPGIIRLNYRADSDPARYAVGREVMISHDENRENDVIFLEKSENIALTGINVWRGAGMGVIAQLCRDIRVEDMHIRVAEGRAEPVSITADAFHFVHCSGRAVIRRCSVGDTLDDAVNIHGIYTTVTEAGKNSIVVELKHHEQLGFCPYVAGDVLNIIRQDGKIQAVELKESILHEDERHITLVFEEDIAADVGDFIENPGRMPEILIEDCDFERCSRMLLSGPRKIVVRNNRIAIPGAVCMMDSLNFWYEAGPVEDVLIEGNVFGTQSPAIEARVQSPENIRRRHRNIRILDNVLNNDGLLFRGKCVDVLWIRGEGHVELTDCSDVHMNEG